MSELGKDSTRIKKVNVQDYNLKELAVIYNVSRYIMRKKMKRYKDQIGEPDGHDYDTKQVKLIFGLITLPSNVLIVTVKHYK